MIVKNLLGITLISFVNAEDQRKIWFASNVIAPYQERLIANFIYIKGGCKAAIAASLSRHGEKNYEI